VRRPEDLLPPLAPGHPRAVLLDDVSEISKEQGILAPLRRHLVADAGAPLDHPVLRVAGADGMAGGLPDGAVVEAGDPAGRTTAGLPDAQLFHAGDPADGVFDGGDFLWPIQAGETCLVAGSPAPR